MNNGVQDRALERVGACVLVLMAAPLVRGREEKPVSPSTPTVEEARKFIDEVQSRLLSLSVEANRAGWVKSTYITDDTEILAAHADQK